MGKNKSFYLSYPEIKQKKQCNPYAVARCYPYDDNFWDLEQKEMYNKIYSTLHVFKHKYVKCSDISDFGTFLSEKYKNLGLEALVSNSSWVWREDIIKQFYGTLFINSECTEMEFMINSKECKATKKDLEEALGIYPRDKNITALHSLPKWKEDNIDALTLYVVPTTNNKNVRHLKPEVDLIQKISRWTLFPRIGSSDKCSDMLLKLSHSIYHEQHFDVAQFLLHEMRIAIETPDHALPYGHYIFCLLRHMKFIPKDIVCESSLLEYLPETKEQPVTIDSVVDSIVKLSENMTGFFEILEERFDTLQNKLQKVERLHWEEVQRRKDWEKRIEKRF